MSLVKEKREIWRIIYNVVKTYTNDVGGAYLTVVGEAADKIVEQFILTGTCTYQVKVITEDGPATSEFETYDSANRVYLDIVLAGNTDVEMSRVVSLNKFVPLHLLEGKKNGNKSDS